jgi:two-component system, NarL family, sensor histidine kinase EvgS
MSLIFLLFFTINTSANPAQMPAKDSLHFSAEEKAFIRQHPLIRFSDVQWEPFSTTTEKNYSGIFRDYYDEIEKVSGLKFMFVPIGNGMNFQSVLDALRDKQIDMIDGTGKTEDRKKYSLFAGPFMQVSLGIASTRYHSYATLQSLKSKRVAIASGSTALEVIKQEFPSIIIYQTQSPDEGLKLLAHRKVEAVIENLVVIDYALQKNGDSNLQVTQIDDYDFKIYALIRNDYPLLQSILQKSIDFVRKQREIKTKSAVINDALYRPLKQVSLSTSEQYYLAHKKEITMCVDPDWEPFETINEEGKHVGIAADLIGLVAKRLGIQIKLLPSKTWQDSLALSKSKQCDIMSFVNQTPEREKWLIFTQPLLTDPNVLITHEEHPFISDLRGLAQESVVLPDGTAVLERMSKDFKNLKFIPVVSEGDAMEMVSEKKADMTIRSLIVAAYIIKKEGRFNLKISGQPQGYENKLRIGVLKEEPILRDILDKGIRTITPIEREAIINKHTGLVVNEGVDTKTVTWIVGGLFTTISLFVLWTYLLRRKVRLEVAKNLRIKDQLYQKAKQAEIGNLIANISHQWREPLSKLSSLNLLTIAKIKTAQPIQNEWLLEQSQKIENTIDFMSHTMQNFLEFYKQNSIKSDFSVYESIEGSISIIETKILDFGVLVTLEGEDSLLNGVKNEWMQVWLNLLNNAIQIFSERNIIKPTIRIEINPNHITFCDNGGGMDMDRPANGLGIPMCREILEKYGASMELYNDEKGLCVRVILAEARV